MSEWREIDTAPKDGTQVLAVRVDSVIGFYICEWSDRWTSYEVFAWNDGEYTYCPTHWMPLPAPPAIPPPGAEEAEK